MRQDVEVSSLEVIEELSVSQQWSPILVFNIEQPQDYFSTLILTISKIRSHNKHTAPDILSNGFLHSREAALIYFGKLILFSPPATPAPTTKTALEVRFFSLKVQMGSLEVKSEYIELYSLSTMKVYANSIYFLS